MSIVSKILLLLFLITTYLPVLSQQNQYYFLNSDKGLPSNHAYFTIKDKYGYLWIATNKGVAKYNGYQFVIFNKTNGIENEDIWHLYEDRKSRIWISSISSKIGYITHNQFHPVESPSLKELFYPLYIHDYNKGIYFVSPSSQKYLLSIEQDNKITTIGTTFSKGYIQDSQVVFLNKGTIYIINNNFKIKKEKIPFKVSESENRLFRNYLIPIPFFSDGVTPMPIYDINSHCYKYFLFNKNEKIYSHYEIDNKCYLLSNKHIYSVSPQLNISTVSIIDRLVTKRKLKENDFLCYKNDVMWGETISTKSDGVLLSLPKFNLTKISTKDYSNIECISNPSVENFFFDNTNSQLIIDGSAKKAIKLPRNVIIYKALKYKSDSIFLLTNYGIAQYVNNRVIPLQLNLKKNNSYIGVYGGCCTDKNKIYIASNIGLLLFKPNQTDKISLIDSGKYSDVIYNKEKDLLVAYSKDKLLINKNNNVIKLDLQIATPNYLIKKIRFLNDNSLVIQTTQKILVLNLKALQFVELFTTINSTDARLLVYNNSIFLFGKFGLAYTTLKHNGLFSAVSLFPNYKTLNYSFVYDGYINIYKQELIINTDKGCYSFNYSNNSIHNQNFPVQLIIRNSDSVYKYKQDLTINVSQNKQLISFDFINPLGTGYANYEYFIDSKSTHWEYLNSKELDLSKLNLNVGEKYRLLIRVKDDIIKSKLINIHIYIMPLWWQTLSGRLFLIMGILLILTIITWTTIQTTKKIVNKKNRQQQLLLEVKNLNLALELKSLYAQINPHFIFNTLNTALYFIKKQKNNDAYTHIASFSQLLRGYLKSSRNKYISLYEEINNLTHYIKLQQARFDHKFEFEITSDLNINLSTTNIPTLLLQPLVENAIQHGLLPKDEHGKLLLKFKKNEEENILLCIIDDNGIGREKSKQLYANNKSISYGTDLINKLIEVYNRNEKIKIDLKYIDKTAPYEGTTVIISIQQL